MHVVATAGHVDHGKSTLVAALTGVDPDRLAEEHRRGLSIELGYCWTSLPGVGEVAFVDVPGHERFIATMLSGVGPVPAVLFVVAADDPWMPQAAEHLAALDALGVRHGVLVVTRSDLCDPGAAAARARAELDRTSLRGLPAVAVSGRTGAGLDELRARLSAMVESLPAPSADADVRLWVDRSFHAKGAGTVVTGTLPAGTISVGDTLAQGRAAGMVRVRSVQSLGRPVRSATGVARVALNLTGPGLDTIGRGSVLTTPGRWWWTDVVDVALTAAGPTGSSGKLPERPLLHIGATSTAVHCRPLGGPYTRLTLERTLPLRIGDHALLRDPGSRTVWGVVLVDPAPPPLRRRGAATARAGELAASVPFSGLPDEVARRGLVRRSLLRRIGAATPAAVAGTDPSALVVEAGDWLLSTARAEELRRRMQRLVAEHDQRNPLDPGVPVAAVATALDLPDVAIVRALVTPPLTLAGGRVTTGRRDNMLPDQVQQLLDRLTDELDGTPFQAPTADRLRQLGLDTKVIGTAVKAGRLLRVGDGIVLLPGADRLAVGRLAELAQPFTTSQARVQLDTSRRVVLALLAHLDRHGLTVRHEDDRRSVRRPPPAD